MRPGCRKNVSRQCSHHTLTHTMRANVHVHGPRNVPLGERQLAKRLLDPPPGGVEHGRADGRTWVRCRDLCECGGHAVGVSHVGGNPECAPAERIDLLHDGVEVAGAACEEDDVVFLGEPFRNCGAGARAHADDDCECSGGHWLVGWVLWYVG